LALLVWAEEVACRASHSALVALVPQRFVVTLDEVGEFVRDGVAVDGDE